MRGSIAIRINDGISDRSVTARTRGLKFSKQSDGGHRAMTCTVTVPRGTFTDLGVSDRVYLSDTRTGSALWEGYLDAPTPAAGPNGERYEISALGAMTRAADETRALIYVDKDLGAWVNELNSSTAADFRDIAAPVVPGKRVMFSQSSLVATNDFAAIGYRSIANAGMNLGGVRIYSGSGKDDAGYRLELYADGSPAPGLFLVSDGGKITTVAADQTFYTGTSYPRSTDAVGAVFSGTRIALQIRRIGAATNVADTTTYSDLVGLSVIGQRMTRTGALLTGVGGLGSAQSVYAHQVVEDLLGRLLTFCDTNTSSVATTTYAIDQLAYTGGTTAQRVLDDLTDYEPNFLWEVLHSTAGGHIFNYRPWPTVARYEISTRDGYTESGSDVDLCNRVLVTWTDTTGATQTTIVTASSATYPALKALEDAGRSRDAEPITLPDGLGSLANAQAIGAAILADSAGQPTSARAVVRRPIKDLYTGAMVMPWEIEPGYLATVRETGALQRLTLMEYDDDTSSTALTLGYPSLTRDQRIAALAKVAG